MSVAEKRADLLLANTAQLSKDRRSTTSTNHASNSFKAIVFQLTDRWMDGKRTFNHKNKYHLLCSYVQFTNIEYITQTNY